MDGLDYLSSQQAVSNRVFVRCGRGCGSKGGLGHLPNLEVTDVVPPVMAVPLDASFHGRIHELKVRLDTPA